MLRSHRPPSDPFKTHWISLTPRLISGGVIVISGLVLIGWFWNIDTLKSVLPTWVTMKANTAIAFLSAGVALGVVQHQIRQPTSTQLRAIAQGCAGATLMIGLLTVSQYLFHINLGIDQLLVVEPATAVGTSHPGRMAPLTAVSFILIGLALLFSSQRLQNFVQPIQAIVFTVGIIAFQALVGYAYKIEALYGISYYTQMAVHTALTFLLLCVGILYLYPNHGLVRILTSSTLAGFLGRRLFFSAMAIPLAVGWLVVQGQQMGFYTAKLGISLLVMLSVVTLALLVWWSITSLERIDAERLGTVQALQDSEASRRELAQVQEALRRSEAVFRSYFELSLVGIAVISPEKGWIEVNAELCRLLGYSEVELCQMTWVELTHPDDLQADLDCFNQVIAGEIEGYALDKRFIRKDGTVIHASMSTRCSRRPDGSVDYFVALVQDVSERVRNEAERRKAEAERVKLIQEQAARAEAEAANRMKDEFLAVLSHELRTPLNAVLGWTRLLRSRQFSPETTLEALETIERNAEVQAQLIDDILDVSRIIQGQLTLNLCLVDVGAVVEAAINSVRLVADAKAIAIHFSLVRDSQADPANTRSLVVSGDPKRLQQIFWNLLSNAIKFTDNGGRVEVSLEEVGHGASGLGDGRCEGENREEANQFQPTAHLQPPTLDSHAFAQITITDTGKGIHPDFLPHVFDRFRQADSSTTRTHGGLGLGLAIVHHLVELHQGTISVDSPGEGQGATFTVRLPLMDRPQSERDGLPEDMASYRPFESGYALPMNEPHWVSPTPVTSLATPSPEAQTQLQGLHVLVVDDDAETRKFLKLVLTQAGAIVTVVSSAVSALDLLDKVEADILVSDIGMPSVDGYELINTVRQRSAKEGGTIGAIALTSYAREEDRQRALQAGFQVHLTKPVEPEILVQAIATLASSTR
ncbi:PAS domain S-box protein [Oscillatoria sp. FACHB-1407]|uniref:ATP-binding protein n=1 Tax=Oscillatoria sp. FACHB-1407 TaxID=2692847 RepID=UPI0016881E41|nr:ATP-binding protein [Oscillatoria sp. FACHB-1407]MBD2461189.1 PAS domain S-box protein [Oscillatoria sp. FACHB-1407]